MIFKKVAKTLFNLILVLSALTIIWYTNAEVVECISTTYLDNDYQHILEQL